MNAQEIVSKAEASLDEYRKYLRPAAAYFHENDGELFERNEAIETLSTELDVDSSTAASVLAELVGDVVDPIVQVRVNGEKWVGVIDFQEMTGAYGYIDYHDVFGKRRRVVCQQCVNEESVDTNVTHATENDPNGSFDDGATYESLHEAVIGHYESSHDSVPNEVETGATLASGTTIGGNTAFHAGNDGSGSNLDADLLDGQEGSYFSSGENVQVTALFYETT